MKQQTLYFLKKKDSLSHTRVSMNDYGSQNSRIIKEKFMQKEGLKNQWFNKESVTQPGGPLHQ